MANTYINDSDPVLASAGVPVVTVSGAAPTAGMVIAATSGTAAAWADVGSGTITLSGDVTGAANANTVVKVNGIAVSATPPSAGNQLIATSGGAAGWAPLNLAGGSNYVAWQLPVGNVANG